MKYFAPIIPLSVILNEVKNLYIERSFAVLRMTNMKNGM